jgi:hypothetical protein
MLTHLASSHKYVRWWCSYPAVHVLQLLAPAVHGSGEGTWSEIINLTMKNCSNLPTHIQKYLRTGFSKLDNNLNMMVH